MPKPPPVEPESCISLRIPTRIYQDVRIRAVLEDTTIRAIVVQALEQRLKQKAPAVER